MVLPRLAISGNKVLLNGGLFKFTGANIPVNEWVYHSEDWKDDTQPALIADKGIRSVMLMLPIEVFNNNASTMNQLDHVIDMFESKGIYCVLMCQCWGEMYDYTGWGSSQWTAFREMWQRIANRYKGRTAVLYSLVDEPRHGSGSEYSSQMAQTIRAIHAIDPNVICIVDWLNTPTGWNPTFNFQLDYPISEPNTMFSCHNFMFDNRNPSKAEVRSWLTGVRAYAVMNQGYPVWVGSFGYAMGRGLTNGQEWVRSMCEVALEDTSGFNVWCWGWRSYLLEMSVVTDGYGHDSEMGTAVLPYYMGTIPEEPTSPECYVDSDCGEGYHCENGVCVADVEPEEPEEPQVNAAAVLGVGLTSVAMLILLMVGEK